MPRVPASYDNITVVPQGGGGQFTNPVDMAGAIEPGRQMQAAGQATQQLGTAMSEIRDDIQRHVNEARVKEADNALADAVRTTLFDPQAGYLNQNGKTAIDGFKDVQGKLDELKGKFGAGLQNGKQQEMFGEVAARRIGQATERATLHAAEQTKVYSANQTEARIKTTIDDAAADPFNVKAVAQSKATMIGEVNHLADLNGVSPEQRDQMVLKATTGLHGAVIDTMMSNDRGTDARQYLNDHMNEIDPEQRARFTATVKQAALKGESTDLADKLGNSGSLSSQTNALKGMYERKEISAELRDATQSRLEHHHGLVEQARVEGERSVREAVNTFLTNNPTATADDLPPALHAEAGRLGMITGASRAAAARRKGTMKDDPAILNGLLYQAQTDPHAFAAQFDPRDYGDSLSQATITKLSGWARGGKGKGGGGSDPSLTTFKSGMDIMKADLAAAGIDTSPSVNKKSAKVGTSGDPAAVLAAFQPAYMWALEHAEQVKGGPLNAVEQRAVGLDLLKQRAVSLTFTNDGGDRRTSTTSGKTFALLATPYAKIPPQVRDRIEKRLRGPSHYSHTVTQAQVENAYRQYVMTGGAGE